jgi:hypothetical protein
MKKLSNQDELILLNLQNKNNIKLFKKTNNELILRDIIKILDECNKIKRKKILNLAYNLKSLSTKNIDLNIIKDLQDNILNELKDIEYIIHYFTAGTILNDTILHQKNKL